jgi:hypothetical protein
MTQGIIVQITSADVLCEKDAGSTPFDLRSNRDTPPEHHHVQVESFLAEFRDTTGHVERPVGPRRARQYKAEQAQNRFS